MQDTLWQAGAVSGGSPSTSHLVALVRQLSFCRNLADVVQSVTGTARAILGADGVTFVLREGDLCYYADEDAIGPLWKGKRFAMSSCISGWVMLNGKTVVVPDITIDPRIPAEAYRPTFVKSLAMAPVRPEAPLAAIGAYWRHSRQPDTWAMELLQAIADTTSLAISHVQQVSAEDRLRRASEDALKSSERRFRMLVDAAVDYAIYWLDLDGRVSSWNSGAQRIKGWHQDEIIGQSFMRFFPPEEVAAGVPFRALRTAAETGHWEGEGWQMRKDGSRYWANAVIDAVRDETGKLIGFVKITRDATERRRAEEALIAAKVQLEQRVAERTRDLDAARVMAERANQAKSRFLAAASHDLRQPFQAIALYYHLLASRLSDPYERKVLEGLGEGIQAGQQLLAALLDVSSLDAGIPQPRILSVALDGVIDPLLRELALLAAEKGLALRGRTCGLAVSTDPVLLGRMVRNLVSNAIKYTDAGGILVGCRRRGDWARIEVWDTGQGIPADKQDAIFDDFVQLQNPERDRSKGLGLGLAIVARTCRLLGCRYGVRSREGKGSVFWIDVSLDTH